MSVLGAAEEAAAVFGEAAAVCIQKQYLHRASEEDCDVSSSRNLSADEVSPRQLKQLSSNNVREVSGSCQGTTMSVRGAGLPPNGGSNHISLYNTPSPVATQVRLDLIASSCGSFYH